MKQSEVQRLSHAPERIWLQVGDDVTSADEMKEIDFHRDVTWCWEQIHDTDIEYIRADHCKRRK